MMIRLHTQKKVLYAKNVTSLRVNAALTFCVYKERVSPSFPFLHYINK